MWSQMKNQDIAQQIARQSGVSRAAAADRVDGVVHQILADLRHGKKISLPGLGTFSQDKHDRSLFKFKREVAGNVSSQG
jgi:nucleoid DNA-binding protein